MCCCFNHQHIVVKTANDHQDHSGQTAEGRKHWSSFHQLHSGSPSGQDLNIVGPNWQPPPSGLLWCSQSSPTCPTFSSPQLCHDIQRAGAHDPGCKHAGGPEVVQQQPRPWDAHELARVRGWASHLHARAQVTRRLPSAFTVSHPSSCVSPPGVQPRPGQRSPEEEEAGRGPAHSEHGPRGATWRPQQVGSRPRLSSSGFS